MTLDRSSGAHCRILNRWQVHGIQLIGFGLLVAVSSIAQAQRTIHVPQDQPTIQAGINAAADGDTVLVAPGTYAENLQIQNKTIVVESAQGAGQTIIDGGGQQNVTVSISEPTGHSATVDGFTIQNGAGGVTSTGAVTLQNDTIKANWGSGVHATGLAQILNNHINTTAPNAGQPNCSAQPGINLSTDFTPVPGMPVQSRVSGNVIEGDGTACSGPGIDVSPVNPVVVENNIVRGTAAGISVDELQTPDNNVRVTIRQNLVYNNENGGLFLEYSAPPDSGGPSIGIGPISIAVTNNTFFNNLTAGQATNSLGEAAAEIELNDLSARMALLNNLIIADSPTAAAVNCNLTNNTSNATPPVFDHNDIYNTQQSSSPLIIDNCGYSGASLIGINGNISANPMFVGQGNFSLRPNSPAAAAGNNSAYGVPTADLAGNPRVRDSKGMGHPNVDMGAYQLAGDADQPVGTLALTASSYNMATKGPLTLTALLNSPSGPVASAAVTFLQDDVVVGSGTTDASGSAKLSLPSLTPGVHRFTASYAGSSGPSPALSTVILVRATTNPGQIGLAALPGNNAACGTPVTFFVLISTPAGDPPPPSGTVTFTDGPNTLASNLPVGPPTGNSEGTQITVTAAQSGTTTVGVSFLGSDGTTGAESLNYTIVADPTTTVLTPSANPSIVGQPVTFTATVTGAGTPTGTVVFTDGSTQLATVTLVASNATTAVATYNTSTLSAGSHVITATTNATGCFDGSSNAVTQTVAAALTATSTTVQASPNPATVGQTVTISATVTSPSGTPGGSVTFFDGTTAIGSQTLSSGGTASISTSSLAVGIHSITATYAGNSTYAGSTSAPFQETIESTVASSFTIAVAPPSVTIQTGHTGTTTVNLSSLGSFADTINLVCSNLPQNVTCQFASASPSLTAGGSASSTLTISTGTLAAAIRPADSRTNPIDYALLLSPFGLGAIFASRRRRRGALFILALVLSITAAVGLSGCGQIIVPATQSSTATPGVYNVLVIGTGKATNSTQSTQLTLTITP